jgi:Mg2+/Co2+ transporter CorC
MQKNKILKEFKKGTCRIAIVVDEFRFTIEIAGEWREIWDEYD